eukprot:CAMPEP_0206004276 /NCGR_PEP_ID=MMETSP1464-20131121/3875_1 /ASSEMBLY_ACC=CAM_ASM_001124 /TAXON_ID=119497 /ORGANISM="Exanthemachrysis gayraliae, Strain RCC1523" /LENGTH=55 /DNA_ID=CAMNT_0053377679 /DNA_START=24 /DNA_END=191 /DNA_ORIENTATION=-
MSGRARGGDARGSKRAAEEVADREGAIRSAIKKRRRAVPQKVGGDVADGGPGVAE